MDMSLFLIVAGFATFATGVGIGAGVQAGVVTFLILFGISLFVAGLGHKD